MRTVLVLGGTGEARALAARLVEVPGLRVVSSLAGRVSRPALPVGEVRIGGFGGVDGLRTWLVAERVDAVVDATHPFARRISANAVAACADVPLLVLRRPGWTSGPGDGWRWVDDIGSAAAELPGERVFLTTGRQDLAAFADCPQWFLVRTVDPVEGPRPQRAELLLARGPYTLAGELALMQQWDIDVLVTKDSGGPLTVAKLDAARERGIPVVVVRRPPASGAPSVESVDDAFAWVIAMRATVGGSRTGRRGSNEMVDFGGLGDKLKDAVDKHEDQVDKGLDKAGDMAGDRFGHADQIDQGVDKLQGLTGDSDR